jgi:CRISPR-associated endonuclease/helicase Cas3
VAPYPWQRKLFQQIVSGRWPGVVDMPTGAGKTGLLWIWWLALAWSRQQKTNAIPIRLAWVVNRRVVVDQVTDEVTELQDKWKQLRFDELPVPAVSTLRGKLADRGDWMQDPSMPAIVVGTVDMIGSRLLFRGYRSGSYWRPIEAGLLGVDTLVVNDEAHLSPAFAKLLGHLHAMRPAEQIRGKSFRYMLLSATQGDERKLRFQHDPSDDAAESARFRAVWMASKRLTLHPVANGPAVKAALWTLATQDPAPRTIVFLQKPEEALGFYRRLKEEFNAVLMTGTMRGKERDRLVTEPAFQLFQRPDPGEKPAFLIATSAAEVGVNLTCERMITELCEADHLIQRFGRMNRFGVDGGGKGIQSEAFVVYAAPKKEQRLKAALEYLQTLDGDASPQKLWSHPPPEEARSEKPKMPVRLEPWRIESWAQTTYSDREVPMPPVEHWVRGRDDDKPETEVAWRADLPYLLDWNVGKTEIKKVLETFPILAEEKLQEPSSRVFEKLKKIGEKLDGRSDRFVVVNRDQSVEFYNISTLDEEHIKNRMVLIPEHIGRVGEHGMFEAETGGAGADVATSGERTRLVFLENAWRFVGVACDDMPADSSRAQIASFAKRNSFRAPLIIRNPQDESAEMLVYLTQIFERRRGALKEISLSHHQREVAVRARKLAIAAGLGEDLAQKYSEAGELHDCGKDHELWQTAMGAQNPPAAKTVAARNPALLNGYRHEFGSLFKLNKSQIKDDLVLHLIATHHASGRPFFEPCQFDPRQEEKHCHSIAREAEQRFGRLQAEYGPWGLAYLEAIFKRADGLVSAEEGDGASE